MAGWRFVIRARSFEAGWGFAPVDVASEHLGLEPDFTVVRAMIDIIHAGRAVEGLLAFVLYESKASAEQVIALLASGTEVQVFILLAPLFGAGGFGAVARFEGLIKPTVVRIEVNRDGAVLTREPLSLL